jgi:hypothetical protein
MDKQQLTKRNKDAVSKREDGYITLEEGRDFNCEKRGEGSTHPKVYSRSLNQWLIIGYMVIAAYIAHYTGWILSYDMLGVGTGLLLLGSFLHPLFDWGGLNYAVTMGLVLMLLGVLSYGGTLVFHIPLIISICCMYSTYTPLPPIE